MTSLAARVLASIRRRRLLDRHTRIVAAVSVGADSVALVHLLAELSKAGALSLVGLAHLDHRLRGEEAVRDREFCRTLAANLGLAFDVEEIDVARAAALAHESVEQAARRLRYEFFERARVRLGADLVAVAHTRNDQAETVLLRLLRGAGTRGLRAIRPALGRLIRPLIDVRRIEVVRYLEHREYPWVEDSTNRDVALLRNWVRRELLPAIAARTGDGVIDVLARTADSAAEDDALLEAMAAEVEARLRPAEGPPDALDAARLAVEPLAIARRVVRRRLECVGHRTATYADVASVLELAAGAQGEVRAAGCLVKLSSGDRVLSFRDQEHSDVRGAADLAERPALATVVPLPVPGTVDLPQSGLRVRAECRDLSDVGGLTNLPSAGQTRAVIPAATAEPGLFVRGWRPGDVLQPFGLSGRKKVQDLFTDRKVPRKSRHLVPIVTAADGRIVWVAGVALGEAFRVTPATKSVVVLSFESLGGF